MVAHGQCLHTATIHGGASASCNSCNRLSQAQRNWKPVSASGSLLHVPRKIRQLVSDLERAGFALVPGGKGSHRKFRHSKMAGSVILAGRDGDDAHHYQEKQVRQAIREASK